MNLAKQLIILVATASTMFAGALANTPTSNVHVIQLDYRPLDSPTRLFVHFAKQDGSVINSDGGCDTYWILAPSDDQYLLSALLTAQSRNAEVYVDIRLIPNTTNCEVWRFITYE